MPDQTRPDPHPQVTDETAIGHHIVHVMGTVVSFDLRDPVPVSALHEAIQLLHHADATFSTYRPDSDLSRLSCGEISLEDCQPDVEEVLVLCDAATKFTDGYFSAYPYGVLDPTGLVKGWAVQRASEVLLDAGSSHHAVNGGGDVQLAGGPDLGPPWRIGITDPADRGLLLAVAECFDGGLATSGTAERGAHIMNPMIGQPAHYFSSVTITAGTLVEADVLATAAFARGADAVDWIEAFSGVEGLFATPDGQITTTSGFPLG
jgi:thiamine biosynthesis lipoprotein